MYVVRVSLINLSVLVDSDTEQQAKEDAVLAIGEAFDRAYWQIEDDQINILSVEKSDAPTTAGATDRAE